MHAVTNSGLPLECDFQDPLLCTYIAEGALAPEEIRARRNLCRSAVRAVSCRNNCAIVVDFQ